MSFWDDLGGLFTGDTYFPDNSNRENRVNELAYDCSRLSGELSILAPRIKDNLKKLNKEIASIYGNPADIPLDAKPVHIQFDKWGVDVAQIIAPLVTGVSVGYALEIAATSYLLATGQIGAAALTALVGLPAAFSIGIGAVAGIAAVGISFAIGAIAGAVKRDKLRDAINGGISSRLKLQKACLINAKLNTSIRRIVDSIEVLKNSGIETSKIIDCIKNMIIEVKKEIDSINDESALAILASIDRIRNSWTEEDR